MIRLYPINNRRSDRSIKYLLENSTVKKVATSSLQDEYSISTQLAKLDISTFLSSLNLEEAEPNVILMPFLESGQIDTPKWNRENFPLLQNLMKHITLSLLFAATSIGFIHKDLHRGNVMLKKTTRKVISYGSYGSLPCLGNIIPVIMDYDRSVVDRSQALRIYDDIKKIITLIETNCDPVFETIRLRMTIERLYSSGDVSPSAAALILKEIDGLTITRLKSERPPAIDFTKW